MFVIYLPSFNLGELGEDIVTLRDWTTADGVLVSARDNHERARG